MDTKILNILKESILNEVSLDMLRQQFVDTNKMSSDVFDDIVSASDGKSSLATWLIVRVLGRDSRKKSKVIIPSIKAEDIYKWGTYFDIFKRHKKEFPIKDIAQIKSPEEVKAFATKAAEIAREEKEDISKIKGVAKSDKYSKLQIGEVGDFRVYKIPKGREDLYQASCDLGSGTEWCTATGKTDSHFKNYIKQGDLYIFDNGKGEKYQISMAAGQFMDKNDNDIFGRILI